MADYYTQTSVILPLTNEQTTKAFEIISNYDKDLEKEGDCLTFGFEKQSDGIWFHGDVIDTDHLVNVIQFILNELNIKEKFCFSWAHSCSKPRLDSFGGGACRLQAHCEPFFIDALEAVESY